MGQCIEVTCPKCRGVFVATPEMLNYPEVEFHCPFCDHYFKRAESPKVRV